MPLRLRCEYAAVFPRSLPGSSCPPPREFPALNIRAGARRPQPISTRFELVPHQGGVTRRFLAYSSPSRSPNPNHLAVLARPGFVRAAPALPGTTRIRLPSAPPSCCDSISDVGLSPPFESLRFTAHPRSAALLRHGCAQSRNTPQGGQRPPAMRMLASSCRPTRTFSETMTETPPRVMRLSNVPNHVPKRHENGPRRCLRGPFYLVAGTGFEPATSGL